MIITRRGNLEPRAEGHARGSQAACETLKGPDGNLVTTHNHCEATYSPLNLTHAF